MQKKAQITLLLVPVMREAGYRVNSMIYMPLQDAVWVSYPDRQFRIDTPGTGADLLKAIVDGIREEAKTHGIRSEGISTAL